MAKRKAYAKPCIAVEDFVLNQFIAGPCHINVREGNVRAELEKIPLYKDMINIGKYFADQADCERYEKGDDLLCYHTQSGRSGPLINS